MKRIIGIVAALLVLGTCWNAEGQSKGQETIQDNAQSNSQDQTQNINELIRECRRLESSGKTKEAADAAIGYLDVGGIDSLDVAIDVMLKEMEYSEALLRQKIRAETDPMKKCGLRSILTILYDKAGNNEMALKEYLRMKWMLNGTGALGAYIAICYLRLGMTEDAIAELESSKDDMLQIDPYAYHVDLGYSYQLAGRYAEAISEYSKAAETDPSKPAYYGNVGHCYESLGALDKALEQYDLGISKVPGEPVFHLRRGQIFLRQGKIELAEAEFKTVTEMDTIATEGSCRQFALYFLGKEKEALEWMDSLVVTSPDDPTLYFKKARLCSLAGRTDEAVSAMKAACELGFNRFYFIERTPDLDNVRDIPAFKSIVETYSTRHKAEAERIRKEIRGLFQPTDQRINQQS